MMLVNLLSDVRSQALVKSHLAQSRLEAAGVELSHRIDRVRHTGWLCKRCGREDFTSGEDECLFCHCEKHGRSPDKRVFGPRVLVEVADFMFLGVEDTRVTALLRWLRDHPEEQRVFDDLAAVARAASPSTHGSQPKIRLARDLMTQLEQGER